MWKQTIQPNPNVPCEPGYCLVYVRDTYSIGQLYGTATKAWDACKRRGTAHENKSFPAGMWVPVWYGLTNNVQGHVVLLAPDGSCYSASSPTSDTPVHHSSLAALEKYYGGRLQYRGWSEEVNDVRVITYEEKKPMDMSKDDIKWNIAGLGGYIPSQKEIDDWYKKVEAGASFKQITLEMRKYWMDRGEAYFQYKDKVSKELVELKPGKYLVK